MPPTAGQARDAGVDARRQGAAPSLAQMLLALVHDVPGLISDRVHLLALELRRARQSFLQLLLMGLAAGILALTAWIALWALFAVVVVAMGLPWSGVLLLILLLNGAGVWFILGRTRALVENLTLPATLRHLTLAGEAGGLPAQGAEDSGLTP
jgi:uncharacterized membrane protein YqjE